MRQVKLRQAILALPFFFNFLFFTPFALAATGVGTDNTFTPPNIKITGPADEIANFSVIDSFTQSNNLSTCTGDTSSLLISAAPPHVSTDETIVVDGVTYPIFSTNIPGIGWIIKVKDGKDDAPYKAVATGGTVIYPTASGYVGEFGYRFMFSWVKYPGNLSSGIKTIALDSVLNVECRNGNTIVGTAQLSANDSTTATIEVTTCKVDTGLNNSINMDPIDWLDLNKIAIGSEYDKVYGKTRITITCDAGIDPTYTVERKWPPADPSNPTSATQIGLNPNSTASGFSLKIKRNLANKALNANGGTPYKIVPEGKDPGTGVVTTAGEVRNLDLFVVLYKHSKIEPGEYSSLADINLIYK